MGIVWERGPTIGVSCKIPLFFSASPQAVGGRCHQNVEGIPRWHQITSAFTRTWGVFMKLAINRYRYHGYWIPTFSSCSEVISCR